MEYTKLIGKEIKKLEIEELGEYMDIYLSDGTVARLKTEGDCCSQTWIESIDNEELRGKIVAIEDIEMPNLGNVDGKRHQGVEEVAYYGLKITTDRGHCVVDYRNDSNGYYGGRVFLVYPFTDKRKKA